MTVASITPAQCRAARALVGLQQGELANRTRMALKTLVDFEAGHAVPSAGNLIALAAVFDTAGVLFLAEDAGGGPGVRLKPGRK